MKTNNLKSKEKQYQTMVFENSKHGPCKMSIRATVMWRTDPKLLGFTLARHKFVAKMVAGNRRVLEVGCGDAFASRIVQPEVDELHSIDFDPIFISNAESRKESGWPVTYAVHDILKDGPYRNGGLFDAAFSLDVIEHIPRAREGVYLANIAKSIAPNGFFICGSPSLESQPYASKMSKLGHINCKTGPQLLAACGRHFKNVFLFGMNDEVLHTGFSPMCHYLFVLAVGPKAKPEK